MNDPVPPAQEHMDPRRAVLRPDTGLRGSVATRVIAFLVVLATCMLLGMEWFDFHRESEEEHIKLRSSLSANAERLSTALSLPLWNFDASQVGKILDSTMQDNYVLAVMVHQADPASPGSQITLARKRDNLWHSVPTSEGIPAEGSLVEVRSITAMGQTIGQVVLCGTPRFLEEEMRERMVQTFFLTLAFDILLIASLYFLLWRTVLDPLRSIERYALAVREGQDAAPVPVGSFHGELGRLRASIAGMVALLQSRLTALKEKETTLRAILDSVPQSIYWKDGRGVYLGCNRTFARDVGLADPEEILGRGDADLPSHGKDLSAHQADDQEIVGSGVPKIHSVESFQNPDGSNQWMDVTKVPLKDAEDRPYAVLGVLEDITARREAEEEHARLQEQLNQAQKLESVGRLAGGVAHDNNNMLMAILMHAELLKERLSSDDPAMKHVRAMEGAAERSAALIRQLLAFSKKQVIEPRVLDLNDLLQGFRSSLGPLIGEDVEFVFTPGRDLWKVRMDPAQIDQIVMNLVVNARDAMPKGGTLSIETTNVRLDETYCQENPWAAPGEFVLLSVSDTGIGMTPEVKKKIFDPFFTTKEVGKGTGLGLSTVFGVVKQNGGFINVYSEPDLGATFRVYLQRFTGQEAQAEEERATGAQASGRGQILVVEDDVILRDVIPRILDRLGFSYILAETPGDALQICYRPDVPIDVLLTDVVMPGMSGKQLWEQVAAVRPNLKVVYMSGYTADVISRQGVLDSGVHFIQKPFSTRELGDKLRSVIG
jgi:PAS domain S-box-containing protein